MSRRLTRRGVGEPGVVTGLMKMMRSLSDEFRNNMPDELKGVIPDFGTMAPPPKKK
jgi:hypothetical protein